MFTYVVFIADFTIEMIVLSQTFDLRHYLMFQAKTEYWIQHSCFKVLLDWFGQQSNDQNYIDSKHLRTPNLFQKISYKENEIK